MERRLGPEVYRALVAPLAGGVRGARRPLHAGRLSPALGAGGKAPEPPPWGHAGPEGAGKPGGGSLFFSFAEGLQALTRRMAEALGERVLRGTPVLGLEPARGRWRLHTPKGALLAEAVVLAIPAPQAAGLLRPFLPEATALLKGIPHTPAATVSLAFPGALPVEGHGLLVAKGEGLRARGFTWTHRKWPGRVPEGFSLVRAYFSGEAARLSEEALIRLALEDLARLLPGLPRVHRAWAFRFPEGMPAYRVGHLDRVERLEMALVKAPGLFLAGNYLQGVGLPEVVRSGRRAAQRALAHLSLGEAHGASR